MRQLNITMDRDTFNMSTTIILLVYFMVMYTLSWFTGKPLDLYGLLAFLAPALNNGVHILSQTVLQKAVIATGNGTIVTPAAIPVNVTPVPVVNS